MTLIHIVTFSIPLPANHLDAFFFFVHFLLQMEFLVFTFVAFCKRNVLRDILLSIRLCQKIKTFMIFMCRNL